MSSQGRSCPLRGHPCHVPRSTGNGSQFRRMRASAHMETNTRAHGGRERGRQKDSVCTDCHISPSKSRAEESKGHSWPESAASFRSRAGRVLRSRRAAPPERASVPTAAQKCQELPSAQPTWKGPGGAGQTWEGTWRWGQARRHSGCQPHTHRDPTEQQRMPLHPRRMG